MNDEEEGQGRPIIGGRHGSPTITVAFPFSKVQHADADVRELVAELADLVAMLATEGASEDAVREAASELAARARESD